MTQSKQGKHAESAKTLIVDVYVVVNVAHAVKYGMWCQHSISN